ncbi:MAG: hypothetical protein M3325_04815, partial [Actinomycetota bacterium]|nr:hypothetical protein [Actinomycetota bacterium]
MAAAFLLLSSAAWACTIFKGHAVMTGNRSGTSTTDGNNSGMAYCTLTPGASASASSGSIVSLNVTAVTKAGCAASNLTAGTVYYLRYYNGAGFTTTGKKYGWNVDCMEGASGTRIGDTVNGYTATSTGLSISNVALPNGSTNSTGQDSAVCLS